MQTMTSFTSYQNLQKLKQKTDSRMRALLSHCDIVVGNRHVEIISPSVPITRQLLKRINYLANITRSEMGLGIIIRSGKSEFNDLIVD